VLYIVRNKKFGFCLLKKEVSIMFNPIAAEVKAEILSKIKSGEKVLDIAKQYGISEKTIYGWLSKASSGNC